MIIGACLLTLGLFWFAWTSSPKISPWPQILAGVPIGVGVQVVLLQSLAYLIDIYTVNANSAISGTVVVRSLIGGGFPLFAIPMYRRFGVCLSLHRDIKHCTWLTIFCSNRCSGLQISWVSAQSLLSRSRSYSTCMERRSAHIVSTFRRSDAVCNRNMRCGSCGCCGI